MKFTARPRIHAPWLIEVRPGAKPSIDLRARLETAPGISWDGMLGCWLCPVELLNSFVAVLEKE